MKCSVKKILALVLSACLLLGVLPLGAFADTSSAAFIDQQVSLGDDLTMKIRFSADSAVAASGTVSTTLDGIAYKTEAISAMEADADGYYTASVSVAAAQMTAPIVVTVNDGGQDILSKTYSVYDYAATLMEGNYSASTKHMVQQMLNYGAKAQLYFGYNTDALANDGYELSDTVTLPSEVAEMEISGKISGVSYKGATLVARNKLAVRFYFNVTGDGSYTYCVGDSVYTPVQSGENYYVEVAGINPQDMDQSIALTVSDGESTLNVSYSPLNYIVRMSAKEDSTDELKALLGAMYTYHDTAKSFVGIQQTDAPVTIASYAFSGTWVNTRSQDSDYGPLMSYDGDADTKWNPEAQSGFAGDPGIIYTLDGWYNLDAIDCTFSTADMYFDVYVSADGKSFTQLAQVNDETMAGIYYGATASLDAAAAEAVKYVKLLFTGRAVDNNFVNLYEIKITGEAVAQPAVQAVITDHEVTGAWVNDQVWDDGTDDASAGPQLSYDGVTTTKWNPQASGNYAQEQGIIYTLDGWYDMTQIDLTFSAADMYFTVYGSSDGEVYTELAAVTADNIGDAYSDATATVSVSAEKVRFVKVMFTGRSGGSSYVNLFEVAIYGKQTTAPIVDANIIAHSISGSWTSEDLTKMKYAYDGDTATTYKWNPCANGSYSGEPGVIFTLDGYYDLEAVSMQFNTANDMYFKLYGSTDGIGYTQIAQVTSSNASDYYTDAVCTVDATAGDAVRYLKIVFTGRNGNSTWVNFYEISVTGSKAILADSVNPVVDAVITSGEVIGEWTNDRIADDGTEDTSIGPAKSYDGDESTKWNPQANTDYAGEPGIIYTLDGWYDLELLKLTVSNSNFYFQVYGSSDGDSYGLITEVTSSNQSALRIDNVYTLDLSAADAIKYVKFIFTGSNTTYVNLYEVAFTGQKVAEPSEDAVVNAGITANEVLGTWNYDRIGNSTIGPEMSYDGSTSTKWNPAVSSYTGDQGIIYTLDAAYDLEQLVFTFASGEIMYMDIYVSADGTDYQSLLSITKDDVSMYADGVATVDATAADGVQYIKVIFTGKSNSSTWINFLEFVATGIKAG